MLWAGSRKKGKTVCDVLCLSCITSDSEWCHFLHSFMLLIKQNLYWWFHHSARVAGLHSFPDWLEVEGHKILKKVDTRWLSLEACVNHIIKQYAVLLWLFKYACWERSSNEGYQGAIEENYNKAYLPFLNNSLSYVSKFIFSICIPQYSLLKEMQQLLLCLKKFITPHAV